MDFFKRIFSKNKKIEEKEIEEELDLPLDETFVRFFTKKGGKFLYSSHQEEINSNLLHIFKENSWNKALCFNEDLQKILLYTGVNSTDKQNSLTPFFTTCEQLIAQDGSILFTSNQLKGHTIIELPVFFIVLARTSQIVNSKDEALMNINIKKNIPSGIVSISNYCPNKKSNDFMEYGNINGKNLYLLLLEDL